MLVSLFYSSTKVMDGSVDDVQSEMKDELKRKCLYKKLRKISTKIIILIAKAINDNKF